MALTVSGYALAEAPLPRKALPGDLLYLAGDRWGRTGAAIRAHYEGRSLEGFPKIREAAFYPLPRLELLALSGLLRGSLDSSDGLAETLWQLADLGVGVEVEALPLYPDVLAFAGSEEAALELVLYGGEEFEAVLVVPQEGAAAVEARAKAKGLPSSGQGGWWRGKGFTSGGRPFPGRGMPTFDTAPQSGSSERSPAFGREGRKGRGLLLCKVLYFTKLSLPRVRLPGVWRRPFPFWTRRRRP